MAPNKANPQVASMLSSYRAGTSGGFPNQLSPTSAEGLSPLFASWAAQAGITGAQNWGQVYAPQQGLPRTFDTYRAGQFGPFEPLYPAAIDVGEPPSGRPRPRRWQYPVGFNLQIGAPGTEGVKLASLQQLRDTAEPQSVLRSCVELAKGDIVALDFDVVPTDDAQRAMQGNPKKRVDFEKRKAEVMEFFEDPDPDMYPGDPDGWLNAMCEDSAVLDAVALYVQPAGGKGNGPCGSNVGALCLLDGSSIKPLMDESGARPRPPEPGYQQILWSMPRVDLMDLINLGPDASLQDLKDLNPVLEELTSTADEWAGDQVIYFMTNPRTFCPYGFSPVEQCLLPASIMQARQTWQFSYFAAGSLPSVFMDPGETIANAEEARQIQEAINMLGGDLSAMHQVIVTPPGSKVYPQKTVDLTSQLDEWITALIVMPFGYAISDLGITPKVASMQSPQASKAAAQTSADRATRRAVIPRVKKMKAKIFDRVIQGKLGQRDMQWSWGIEEQGESKDNLVTQQTALVHGSIATIDEARIALEMDPLGLPETTVPLVFTPTGALPLGAAVALALNPPAPTPIDATSRPLPPDNGKPLPAGAKPPTKPPTGGPTGAAKPKPGASPSPAHAGSTAVVSSPPDDRQSSEQKKAVGDELAQLRRYLAKGRPIDRFTPHALPAAALKAARGATVEEMVASVAKAARAAEHKQRALAQPRSVLAGALGGLANRLANGGTTQSGFVADATVALAAAVTAAYRAGADRAVTGAPDTVSLTPIDDDTWDGLGQTRADNQKPYLTDFAAAIATGMSTAALSARADLYGASLSRAYEEGYITQGSNGSGDSEDGTSDGTASMAIIWNLGDSEIPCPLCEDRDGQSFTPDDLPGYPGDGCVTGDTLVDSEIVEIAFRRRYEGPIVEISTAGGRSLSITPNHPVLTGRGWIRAEFVKPGDCVVSAVFGDGCSLGDPHIQNGPTRIEDIFTSLSIEGTRKRMTFVGEDFDVEYAFASNIKVVEADELLGDTLDTAVFEPRGQFSLVAPNGIAVEESALGRPPLHEGGPCVDVHRRTVDSPTPRPVVDDSTVNAQSISDDIGRFASQVAVAQLIQPPTRESARLGISTAVADGFEFAFGSQSGIGDMGSPSVGGDGAPFLKTEGVHPQAIAFAGRTTDAEFGEPVLDDIGFDAEGRGDLVRRFPSEVALLEFRHGSQPDLFGQRNLGPDALRLLNRTWRDASGKKTAPYGSSTDVEFLCQLQLRGSVEVALDEIVNVEEVPFCGDVFNLQSRSAYYLSNGVVVHNSFGDICDGGPACACWLALEYNGDTVAATDTSIARQQATAPSADVGMSAAPKDFSLSSPLGSGFVPFDLASGVQSVYPDVLAGREVVERCGSAEQAERMLAAMYDPAEYEVVGDAICVKSVETSTVSRARDGSGKAILYRPADDDELAGATLPPVRPSVEAAALDGPVAAGLVVRAEDTGRVLLLQRAHDPSDPASGTFEAAGGHIEVGQGETPFAAACREFSEEVGCPVPDGQVVGMWESATGIYQGFVLSVPHESDVAVNLDYPRVDNPDAPLHAKPETAVWFDIDDLAGMPSLRPELAADLPRVLPALRAPLRAPGEVLATKAAEVDDTAEQAAPRMMGSSIDEQEVFDYLSEHYPDSDLSFVSRCLWGSDNILLSQIDYQNRPGGIDADKVADMAAKLQDGWQPHPVVLIAPDAESQLAVCDGFHRLNALAEAGQESVAAWVGSPKPGNTGWRADILAAQFTVTNHAPNQ